MTRIVPLIALLLALAPAAWGEERIELPAGPQTTQAVLYDAVANPVASVILMIGGDGDFAHMPGVFLLRVRQRFVAAHMSVAVPDTPSDHPGGFGPLFRLGGDHTEALATIAFFLKKKSPAPVWLVGHSNGTISAASAAQRLGPDVVAGVVLSSSVWLGGLEQAPTRYIMSPVLLVHNRNDACPASPFALAEASLSSFVLAPKKKFVAVTGPNDGKDRCGAETAHDFYDAEDKAVPPMLGWILSGGEERP
jgi:pimeloyl-ACP methyl ester carboxylesterase